MSTPQAAPAKDNTGAAGTVVTEAPKPAAAPANGAPAAAPAAQPQGAPAAGANPEPAAPAEYKLVLPEGSKLDPGAVERIAAEAKAKKLTQEQAQESLLREDAAVAAYVKGQDAAYEKEKNAWLEAIKTDSEIGGQAFDESVTLAKRAVDSFGSDAFKKALDETGLGNHPELVRTFARIGKALGDDKILKPGTMPAGKKSAEEVFYGAPQKTEE